MKKEATESWVIAWSAVFLILATVVVTCLPVLGADYAFSDDFGALGTRPLSPETVGRVVQSFNNEGRYLFPIWFFGLMGQAGGVQDLALIRLMSFGGIFFSSIIFYKLVRQHLFEDRMASAMSASLFAINPAFLIMAAWASIGCDAYACFLGLTSSYFLLRKFCNHETGQPLSLLEQPKTSSALRSKWIDWFLSGLFLLAALCLYQPGAMLFWTGVAIWLIGRFTNRREDWLKLGKIGVLFLVVLGVYFILSRFLSDSHSRLHVSTSVVRRMGWYVVFPLRNVLSYPSFQIFTGWSIVAFLILSSGLWFFCRQTSRSPWILPLVWAGSPMTMLPVIFAWNHYNVFRVMGALYGLVIILWVVTFAAAGRFFGASVKLWQVLAPILIIFIVLGQYRLERYLIVPQIREESALQIKLQEYVRDNPKLDRTIVLWPPPKSSLLAGYISADEFGMASTSQTWASVAAVREILAGVTHRKYEEMLEVQVVPLFMNEAALPGAFTIDLRGLSAP